MIYWSLLGLVIGLAAAHRKGWSLFAGALGGALLGPLALLLFFVSGVTRGDQQREYPHCAEWVKAAAKVCKHCGREIALLAIALAASLTLAACGQPATTAAPPPQAAATQEPSGSDDVRAQVRAELELQAVRSDLAEAQARITELEREAAAQQDEAARYKTGLDRCVAKLNEVSAEAVAASDYEPAPAAPRRSRGTARVSTLGAPTISLVDGDAFVTVRLWNGGDGDASGRVTLELVCGGRVVDSSTQGAEITARTDQVVTATLHTIAADGNCSARAALDF